jgi:hypothetical protein
MRKLPRGTAWLSVGLGCLGVPLRGVGQQNEEDEQLEHVEQLHVGEGEDTLDPEQELEENEERTLGKYSSFRYVMTLLNDELTYSHVSCRPTGSSTMDAAAVLTGMATGTVPDVTSPAATATAGQDVPAAPTTTQETPAAPAAGQEATAAAPTVQQDITAAPATGQEAAATAPTAAPEVPTGRVTRRRAQQLGLEVNPYVDPAMIEAVSRGKGKKKQQQVLTPVAEEQEQEEPQQQQPVEQEQGHEVMQQPEEQPEQPSQPEQQPEVQGAAEGVQQQQELALVVYAGEQAE